MLEDPAGAQALLESRGDQVKIPIFIEANIHGGEEEGTDAMMQVIRDLVHGTTTADDRYAGPATNPFSRIDAERSGCGSARPHSEPT